MNIELNVLTYINNNQGTSYAELEHLFDELNFEWRGNFDICSGQCENVILWTGWNKEAIEVINNLKRSEKIEQVLTDPIIYLIDGKALNMPIVKKYKDYKKPHWLPVVFTTNKARG